MAARVAVKTAAELKLAYHATYSVGGLSLALSREGIAGPIVLDANTCRETAKHEFGTSGGAGTMNFTPDNQWLAFGGADHRIHLWRFAPPLDPPPPRGHGPFEAWSVAFSPDGLTVATASKDQTIRVWDPANGQEMLCLNGHRAWVNGVAFHADGGMLASVDHAGNIRLWRSSAP